MGRGILTNTVFFTMMLESWLQTCYIELIEGVFIADGDCLRIMLL